MKPLALVGLLGLASPCAAQTPALSPAERTAYDAVSQATIKDITTMLASRALEGRGTGQPGADRAADSIAARMRRAGLAPLGDGGTYLQKIPFVSTTFLPTSSIAVGSARLTYGDEFVVAGSSAMPALDVSGALAFVSYGLGAQGSDVNGKIVVVLGGKPTTADSTWDQNVNPRAVARSLVAKGAAAVFLIPDPNGPPFALYRQYLTRRGVRRGDDSTTTPAPTLIVTEAAAAKLAAGLPALIAQARAGTGRDPARQLGAQAQIAIRANIARTTSSNVVGVLRGGDPSLAGQAVVFTAHYDAFGIENGTIYPGAADNALGTAMMLAAADVVTKGPRPRRSIIFLAVTGEEYGLFGALYWTQHPTWPIDSIAADFNYDGIGTETHGPVTHVVGWGGDVSDLGKVMQDVVTATGNTVSPDPFPEEGAFYRSDHYAFVLRGVPALMLLGAPSDTGWVHRAKAWLEGGDYHQPGDSVHAGWDWSGPRTLAATGLLIGLRVANATTLPAWLPGTPFRRH